MTNGEAAPSVRPSARKRVAGDIFYLRSRIFDPDRLFDWLIPPIRFLFTPYFLALSAALVVGAAGVSVVNWTEIVHQSGALYRFESLALAAGFALGFSVLVRPTDALALVPAAIALGFDWRRAVLFVLGGVPALNGYSFLFRNG